MATPPRAARLPIVRSAAVGLCLLAATPAARSADLDEATFLLEGATSVKLDAFAARSGRSHVRAHFEPPITGSRGIVSLEDAFGFVLNGLWSLEDGKLDIEIADGDVEAFLTENLPLGVSDLVAGVQVLSVDASSRLVETGEVGTLGLKVRFKVRFRLVGVTHTLRYSLSAKGQADVSGVPFPGSRWSFPACAIGVRAGRIKLEEADDLELVLGSEDGLAADRFVLERAADGAALYSGYYIRVGDDLTLLPDADELEDHFTGAVEAQVDRFYPGADVFVERVLPPRFAARIQKSGGMQLVGSAFFAGSFHTEDPDTGRPAEKAFRGRHALQCTSAASAPAP